MVRNGPITRANMRVRICDCSDLLIALPPGRPGSIYRPVVGIPDRWSVASGAPLINGCSNAVLIVRRAGRLPAAWLVGAVLARAVIRGGRADKRLGLRLGQLVRSRQLVDLVLLGVARLEVLTHRVRQVHGLGRRTEVDAM